jgi:hypothetical protein
MHAHKIALYFLQAPSQRSLLVQPVPSWHHPAVAETYTWYRWNTPEQQEWLTEKP